MDMGIIAAFKKRYKHISLKEILTFHDLPPIIKQGVRKRLQECDVVLPEWAGSGHCYIYRNSSSSFSF